MQNLKTILLLREQIGTPEIQIYLNQTKYGQRWILCLILL